MDNITSNQFSPKSNMITASKVSEPSANRRLNYHKTQDDRKSSNFLKNELSEYAAQISETNEYLNNSRGRMSKSQGENQVNPRVGVLKNFGLTFLNKSRPFNGFKRE
jgi:hypothetical protein